MVASEAEDKCCNGSSAQCSKGNIENAKQKREMAKCQMIRGLMVNKETEERLRQARPNEDGKMTSFSGNTIRGAPHCLVVGLPSRRKAFLLKKMQA